MNSTYIVYRLAFEIYNYILQKMRNDLKNKYIPINYFFIINTYLFIVNMVKLLNQ